MKKIIKWTLIAIVALGLIFSFCVVSKCDYEDYCHDHGVEAETETNPLTALYGLAVAIPAAGVAYIIEGKDKN